MRRLLCLCLALLCGPLAARAEPTWTLEVALPEGPGPHPVVIFLPGCGGWGPWERHGAERHAAALAAAGWGFARLDVLGPRGLDSICRDTGLLGGLRGPAVADASAAAESLAADPRVDGGRLVFMGQSFGGSVALDIASPQRRGLAGAERRFAAVVAYYPWCYANYGWPPGADFDTPILILAGAADEWTPVSRCRNLTLKDAALPFRIEVFPEAYHSFDLDEMPRYVIGSVFGPQIVEGNAAAAAASRETYNSWLTELFLRIFSCTEKHSLD